jgi:hypothetical protein
MIKYEKITQTSNDKVTEYILATFDDSDVKISIPIDEANSDYQAYLNPVEHLTEIPTE